MRMLKTLTAVIFAAALPCLAFAQSSPNWAYKYVPTPAEWNNAFAVKQDILGFTPMNQAGGVFLGRVVTAPPGASTSGLNLTPGSTPASPSDGDLWITSAGIFARVNGATYDLVGAPCLNCALTNIANTFTASPQIVQGLTTTSPGWYAQITGDTVPRVRIGLNATDIPSVAFGPGSGNRDTFIERLGPASFRFGAPDAAAPVAQTFGVQNVVAGTSNTAGAGLVFQGSRGTGNAAGGSFKFQIAPAGGAGSSQNSLVDGLTIFGTGGLASGAATDQGAGTLNLAGSLYNNGTAPTGTGGYVRATSPTIAGPTITGTLTGGASTLTSVGTLTGGATGAGFTVAFGSATLTGQVPIGNGGTGQTTQPLALNALMPAPTRAGDIVYWNGSNWVTLAGNNSGTLTLQENASGVPSWASVAGTGTVTSAVIAAGTGISVGGTCTITTSGTCTVTNLGFVTAAAKSDQQTGTSNTLAVTPLHQQDHDSAIKVWVSFTGTAGGCPAGTCAVLASYNVNSVARTGTGTYVVTFGSTPFASANFSCTGSAVNPAGVFFSTKSTTQVAIITGTSGSPTDATAVDVHCMGRQ